MTAIGQLEELMAQGWNIHIECKGKGRGYEMTYEAQGQLVLGQYEAEKDILHNYGKMIHAVGDTFDELIEKLRTQTLPKTGEQLTLEV